MQPVRSAQLFWLDGLLAACALVGVLLLTLVLPRVHPNAAASYALTEEGATAAAARFLAARGFETDGLDAAAYFLPAPDLLHDLQQDLGRKATRDALTGNAGEGAPDGMALPAFRWEVDWVTPGQMEGEGRLHYVVWLTQDGAPFGLDVRDQGVGSGQVDARALAALLQGDTDAASGPAVDSLRTAPLRFAALPELGVTEGLEDAEALRRDRAALRAFAQRLPPPAPPEGGLSAAAAVALARFHLGDTWLARLDLAPTRVRPLGDGDVVLVRFRGAEPVLGQEPVADVHVDARGVLRALRFATGVEAGADPVGREERLGATGANFALNPSSAVPIIAWTLIALVVLIGHALFVRRLIARAVDTRTALIDAGLVFAATLVWSFLTYPYVYLRLGAPLSSALFFTLVGGLVWAAAIGLLVFVAAATTDSMARSVFVEKLDALVLARNGAWLNRPVGLGLLRGTLAGVALAGLPVAVYLLVPARVPYNLETFAFLQPDLVVAPRLMLATLWTGVLVLHYGVLGAGSAFARARRHRGVAVVVGLTVLGALTVVGPVGGAVGPSALAWLFAGAYASAVALLFWKTDALTAFWAVFFSLVLYEFATYAVMEASPASGEVLFVALVVLVVLALGAAALRMDRTGRAVRRPEPAYILDLAARERLEREVEIAREVQRSFLPAAMPEVPGLDLAATCVPAQEVGGDYYDLVPLGEGPGQGRRLAVVVGDVSGKGIQAAFYMTLVKGFLRTLCREIDSPAAVLRRVNRLFCENVPTGAFISMVYGVFDLDARTFTFARAGHNPLILKRAGHARADLLQPSGIAIGLAQSALFDDVLVDHTVDLRPGDTLVFYTDGFSEAIDDARDLYGDARLAATTAEAMREVEARAAAQLLGTLVADVSAFAAADGLRDDMTMVVVRVDTPGEAAPVQAAPVQAARAEREVEEASGAG